MDLDDALGLEALGYTQKTKRSAYPLLNPPTIQPQLQNFLPRSSISGRLPCILQRRLSWEPKPIRSGHVKNYLIEKYIYG